MSSSKFLLGQLKGKSSLRTSLLPSAAPLVRLVPCARRRSIMLKTRAMTGRSPVGEAMLVTIKNILATEGPKALFKGALFRIAWIAPLGAMNFAGYELAKRAMGAEEESMSGSSSSSRSSGTAKGEDDFVVLTNEDKSNNYPSEDDFGDFFDDEINDDTYRKNK